MKTVYLAAAMLVLSFFTGEIFAETIIIRGEISIADGREICFSAPVGILEALKTSGISALVENKDEFCRLIDALGGELESAKDNDLLIFKAKNEAEAHVWLEEADGDEPMRDNFVFVDIEAGENEPEVSLRLPQGIFFLSSFIGNQLAEIHGEEVLETMRQSFLMKIREKARQSKHEPFHDERDVIEQMHRRIGHLKEKTEHLRREGRHEEAERLEQEVHEIHRNIEEMEHGHKPPHDEQDVIEQMHRRIGHLKEKTEHLRREGRHEEAERLEQQVHEIRRNIEEMEHGHKPPHHVRLHSPEHRNRMLNEAVGHLFEAVEKLREGDMHELADKLAIEAENYREAFHR
jgi:hypothetical protein